MEVVKGENTYYVAGNIMLIMLTQGQIATIDSEDYDKVKGYKWHAVKHTYRQNITYYVESWDINKSKHILIHRLLLNFPKSLHIDHKNRNPLDNCRCNIRIASSRQNNANCLPRNRKSRYKGVRPTLDSKLNPYQARIGQDHLGRFSTEIAAARAYDIAALERYGDFAQTNFPRSDYNGIY